MNQFQQLYKLRKLRATKPFAARGKGVNRCEYCQVAIENCICSLKVESECQAGVMLIMHDSEILKPSNTGRLIADVVPDCFPFLWSRTEPDQAMLAILEDPQWYPMIVFPMQYAQAEQQVITERISPPNNRKLLFIILDGSWREARRMFRKSPYLAQLPLVTIPANQAALGTDSRYALRDSQVDNHLATAEVAAKLLSQQGEEKAGKLLDLWFDVFSWQYQKSVCQKPIGSESSISEYQSFVKQHSLTYKDA